MALIIRRSQIHGTGCYTTTPIPRGKRVIEYTGPRITVDEGDRRYENREMTYLFGLSDGKYVIDGRGTAKFINHSCNPNCESEEEDGRVWIVAMRNIKAGEELSYDYLLYEGDGESPCHCKASKCRGTLYAQQKPQKGNHVVAESGQTQPSRNSGGSGEKA